jgi:ribosomal protein L11 methyltransferase
VDYPALDVESDDVDLLYALLDDFDLTAVEERENGLRAFFASRSSRDHAAERLTPRFPVAAVDVPDEDWARRSQANLRPVTVGRITIHPFAPNPQSPSPSPDAEAIDVVIPPSIAFGTGHHATTRLCLAALQTIDVRGATVIDIGTGSGVLAIAAALFGASCAIGIDNDPDALQAAGENLALNPAAVGVRFELTDLRTAALPRADVATANLTGTLLVKAATALLDALKADGILIVSGLLHTERDDVLAAFGRRPAIWEGREDEWVALAVKKS